MQTGAVVMMDALGFRGIWRDFKDYEAITDKMHALKLRAEMEVAEMEKGDIVDTSSVAFLSDTIVIGAAAAELVVKAKTHSMSVLLACYRAATVLAGALETPPHFAYRGCVTFGQFEIDGPFLLGPAIDEAASCYEVANGAFVWLTPSAKAVFEATDKGRPALSPLVRYEVPLKGGASFDSWVVSPFASVDTPERRATIASKMLATFDKDTRLPLDVQIKKQNTMRFLEYVMGRLDEAQRAAQ
jgi:hypothetical protein